MTSRCMSCPGTLALIAGVIAFPHALEAQEDPAVVRVAGSGEVSLPPDYATLGVGVRVQDSTAEAATAEMSARIESVVDTLEAMGFPGDSLPTRVFSVTTDRARGQDNRITGYSAQVTLQLRTSDLDRLAEIVGGCIAAGATEVGRVDFGSTRAEAARADALRLALEAAEGDAEVIAAARGARLGRLIEVSTSRGSFAVMARRSLEIGSTGPPPLTAYALSPSQITVRASVEAVWELLAPAEPDER